MVRGSNVCLEIYTTFFFFFSKLWTLLVRIKNFLSICKISHSEFPMSPFCYINLGWAANGIIWNIGTYDLMCKEETGEADPLHSLPLMPCAVFHVASTAMRTTSLDIVLFQLLVSLPYLLLHVTTVWQGCVDRIFLSSEVKVNKNSYMMNGSELLLISLLKEMCFFFLFLPLFLQINEGEIRQAWHGWKRDGSKDFLMFQSILSAAYTYVIHWESRPGVVIK